MKKRLLIAFKATLTVLVLGWVLHKLGPEGRARLLHNIQTAHPASLGMALGTMCVVMALGVIRWQCLLRVQGIHLTGYQTTWITAVGAFFNSFLLGATGGDVWKAWYAASATRDRKAEAVMSVAVDRLIGLLGLLVLGNIVVLGNLPLMMAHNETKPLVHLVAGGLIASVAVLALSTRRHWITSQPWWGKVWKFVPAKNLWEQLSKSYNLYGKHPRILVFTLAISVLVHLLSVVAAWFVGEALSTPLSNYGVRISHFLVYCPLINAIAAMPITVGGVGLRENAFNFFFGLQGVPRDQATALSLLFYGILLSIGFLCGILFLVGKPSSLAALHPPASLDPTQPALAQRSTLEG